ncbi:MAG: glycosyltransferase [Actinomycetota bacterium]|nr:glycosyltransferase [Actinomycetota bacterium]
MHEIPVTPLAVEPLLKVIGSIRYSQLHAALTAARELLGDRVVWNVNSAGAGGGVAEMLARVLGYFGGAGVATPWLVVDGDEEFFITTKRLHNALHGMPGDGGPLGPVERRHYEDVLAANASDLGRRVRPGDVAVLHDPQVLGLAASLRQAGVTVVWRSHIGADSVNPHTERGWAFLRPDLGPVDAFVFSRQAYAPRWLEAPVFVMPPTIDPLSVKNQAVDDATTASVLEAAGIVAGGSSGTTPHAHGGPYEAEIIRSGPAPDGDVPLVVQVSRWDSLKDPSGFVDAFRHVEDRGCHLVVAGPQPGMVADDPEAARVLSECVAVYECLPADRRRRVHLVSLPIADVDANGLMVNALQRHAAVVVQKSLAEGFGLTVTEAMWKDRPVVASGVGGIRDQIVDRRHGWLLDDPRDPLAVAGAVDRLLAEPAYAASLGAAAGQRVRKSSSTTASCGTGSSCSRRWFPDGPRCRPGSAHDGHRGQSSLIAPGM